MLPCETLDDADNSWSTSQHWSRRVKNSCKWKEANTKRESVSAMLEMMNNSLRHPRTALFRRSEHTAMTQKIREPLHITNGNGKRHRHFGGQLVAPWMVRCGAAAWPRKEVISTSRHKAKPDANLYIQKPGMSQLGATHLQFQHSGDWRRRTA